jgi:hypothetical protein
MQRTNFSGNTQTQRRGHQRVGPPHSVHRFRQLRVEPLEVRRFLSINVDTLVGGIGVPGTSLREAIDEGKAI